PGTAPPGNDREPGRRWANLLVLALCGRRLGGGVYGGLPRGALSHGLQPGANLVERMTRMASDPQTLSQPEGLPGPDSVEMPRPTAAPLILALGLTLVAAGVAFGLAFLAVGAAVFVAGLSIWIGQLLPGRGHVHESVAEPEYRPRPAILVAGGVEQLRP